MKILDLFRHKMQQFCHTLEKVIHCESPSFPFYVVIEVWCASIIGCSHGLCHSLLFGLELGSCLGARRSQNCCNYCTLFIKITKIRRI